MRFAATGILLLVTFAATGCKTTGMLAKREAEKCCPTDIRKTVPWCAGEDAIFQCPCKPSCEFYGYKPTCWGTWPASGAAWRDMHCGDRHHEAVIMDLTNKNPELITLPEVQPIPAVPIDPEARADQSIVVDEKAEREEDSTVEEKRGEQEEAAEAAPDEDLPKPNFGPIRLPDIGPE